MSTRSTPINEETAFNRSLIDLDHEANLNTSSPRVSKYPIPEQSRKMITHKFANGHAKEELVSFAANSSRISTYGKRTLELDLSLRRSFNWQFVVADVATAIMGADFLSNYNLLIDLKGRRLIDSTTGLTSDGKVLKAQQVNISTVNPAESFKDLLAQYIAVTKPQVTTNIKSCHFSHRITTTGPPVAARFRKIFGEKTVAARPEIQDLLNRGILRPSNSP
ncbi:uncharacterized protein LOC113373895 [Ctenocephalides felis]|uniref:uncharacterized protein LOC113373895 n=1 Tax=Ctenocephalides felis TaxID=7515 RepID=UPI000E6E3B37|nr:uncharacterized protein LOC113373895 [Ctenocephalides felis]